MRSPLVVLPFVLAACGARSAGPAFDAGAPTDVGGPSDTAAPFDARTLPALDVPAAPVCVPGAQLACACVGGGGGVQVCAPDGRSVGPCACPDAGAPVDAPPIPLDEGSGSECSQVADPPLNVACTPPPSAGGRAPYYQCTVATVCPRLRFTNDRNRPGYRVTYLKITQPAALASNAILNTINPTLIRGTFLWGLDLDLGARTFRTGALHPSFDRGSIGVGLMDGRFRFFANDAPTADRARFNAGSAALAVTASRASSALFPSTVTLPIFSDEGGTLLLTQLPLDSARFTGVHLTADRGCIGGAMSPGGRYTETTSRWITEDPCDQPYGVLDADITVQNARNVQISALMTSLCNVIAGADCATTPQSSWPRQPDSTVNGAPAFHLRANFAAISANIAR